MTKKILYVDMDNVLVDFQSGIDKLPEPQREEFDGRLDEAPGIFSLMEPIPGAIKAYCELAERFDTYILSTSPWENPTALPHKLAWVQKHLPEVAYKRLILSHHKHLNRGHFLVDDRGKNGASEFGGTWIEFGSEVVGSDPIRREIR